MSLMASLRRWFLPSKTESFDARMYWEQRHHAHRGSLRAVGHRSLGEDDNRTQYEIKTSHVTRLLQRRISVPQGKTLLDAGCGVGVLTQACVDLGFRVTGVDLCGAAVEQARRRMPESTFTVSSLAALDLEERFDVVCAIDVLLHVVGDDEWRKTLETLVRHLKRSGLLILLDCLDPGDTAWAKHCRPRPLGQYQAVLNGLGWHLIEHERFTLPREDARKDLAAFHSRSTATPV